jgi:hypothetical protein
MKMTVFMGVELSTPACLKTEDEDVIHAFNRLSSNPAMFFFCRLVGEIGNPYSAVVVGLPIFRYPNEGRQARPNVVEEPFINKGT